MSVSDATREAVRITYLSAVLQKTRAGMALSDARRASRLFVLWVREAHTVRDLLYRWHAYDVSPADLSAIMSTADRDEDKRSQQ